MTKKDSIFRDVENKVDKSLKPTDYFSDFKIDSITIDDFIKRRIVEKYGDKFKID